MPDEAWLGNTQPAQVPTRDRAYLRDVADTRQVSEPRPV